uniref:Uncharacterized protein n=1 Tax=Candidatus Kentrum sp. FW TaxID=2126338 RepID=A0A450T690_9GAMM|nr:MAG: hypothetical protein BECKFW1821C_GA0114237_10029 [Candidatus Kentron sp. FW]
MSSSPTVSGEPPPELLFVYNANSGLFNTVTDIAHKFLSPDTYRCRLCALSHSYFSMRKEWKEFLETLTIGCDFLHADEFRDRYPGRTIALPAVLWRTANDVSVCLDASMIDGCESMDDLKLLIVERCVAGRVHMGQGAARTS